MTLDQVTASESKAGAAGQSSQYPQLCCHGNGGVCSSDGQFQSDDSGSKNIKAPFIMLCCYIVVIISCSSTALVSVCECESNKLDIKNGTYCVMSDTQGSLSAPPPHDFRLARSDVRFETADYIFLIFSLSFPFEMCKFGLQPPAQCAAEH